jgi:transcriptional regulator with XRE-family HTH domain
VVDGRMRIPSTGHSRHLRNVLRAARLEQGMSAQDVADRIAGLLGKPKYSGQSVLYYEGFQRHPPVDVFAAWARAVGYRLIVDVDKLGNERAQVLLRHPEVIEIAKALDDAPEDVRGAVATIVRNMIR